VRVSASALSHTEDNTVEPIDGRHRYRVVPTPPRMGSLGAFLNADSGIRAMTLLSSRTFTIHLHVPKQAEAALPRKRRDISDTNEGGLECLPSKN